MNGNWKFQHGRVNPLFKIAKKLYGDAIHPTPLPSPNTLYVQGLE